MTKDETPRVLCVMLAAGRLPMVKRSIAAFRAQTYKNRALYVLDNGDEPLDLGQVNCTGRENPGWIFVDRLAPNNGQRLSIGALRNIANCLSGTNVIDAPLIAHWDSDDWYHPERLSSQVSLLHEKDVDLVGYRSVLLWDSRPGAFCGAWSFTSQNPQYCIGASFLYHRETWQRHPFKDVNTAEDTLWLHNRISVATADATQATEPRMIAGLHGQNTCSRIQEGKKEWRRTPEWDAECRRIMTL